MLLCVSGMRSVAGGDTVSRAWTGPGVHRRASGPAICAVVGARRYAGLARVAGSRVVIVATVVKCFLCWAETVSPFSCGKVTIRASQAGISQVGGSRGPQFFARLGGTPGYAACFRRGDTPRGRAPSLDVVVKGRRCVFKVVPPSSHLPRPFAENHHSSNTFSHRRPKTTTTTTSARRCPPRPCATYRWPSLLRESGQGARQRLINF